MRLILIGALISSGLILVIVGFMYKDDLSSYIQAKYLSPIFTIPEKVNIDFAIDIIDGTNIERKKTKLSSLKENSALSYAAYLRARDILNFQDFSHEATKSGNRELRYVVQVVGYRYSNIGENLALGYDPNGVITGWLNSPGHKENILNKDFDEIGVAVLNGSFQGNDDTYVIVQLFGKL